MMDSSKILRIVTPVVSVAFVAGCGAKANQEPAIEYEGPSHYYQVDPVYQGGYPDYTDYGYQDQDGVVTIPPSSVNQPPAQPAQVQQPIIYAEPVVQAPLPAVPADAVPFDAVPADAVPYDAVPADAVPVEDYAGNPASDRRISQAELDLAEDAAFGNISPAEYDAALAQPNFAPPFVPPPGGETEFTKAESERTAALLAAQNQAYRRSYGPGDRSTSAVVGEISDPSSYRSTPESEYLLPVSASAPPVGGPGECYAEVKGEPVYRTVTRQVPDSTAGYREVQERVLEQPARTEWRENCATTSITGATGRSRCLVHIPATYRTIVRKDPLPASTRTVTEQVLVSQGNSEWRRVPCGTQQVTQHYTGVPADVRTAPVATLNIQVQRSLRDKGYNPGSIDGKIGPRTRSALGRFQATVGLPVTNHPDGATLQALGIYFTNQPGPANYAQYK